MSWLFAFGLGWLAGNERRRDQFYFLRHVAKGGCLNEYETAMTRCLPADADPEACVKATAALRKCFAAKPEMFGDYFMDRLDRGLDQDTKPTPREIEEEERRGTYRWWAGMRRS